MKLSKELVLQAVNAAFEFNTENENASAHVTYDAYSLTLGLSVFGSENWTYYKISARYQPINDMHADSHEKNLEYFLDALKSHTSHV